MLKNYFAVAGPGLTKPKVYALINVVGLAFGICACIAIFLVTDYKFGFGKFDSAVNRSYRIPDPTQKSAAPATESQKHRGSQWLSASVAFSSSRCPLFSSPANPEKGFRITPDLLHNFTLNPYFLDLAFTYNDWNEISVNPFNYSDRSYLLRADPEFE